MSRDRVEALARLVQVLRVHLERLHAAEAQAAVAAGIELAMRHSKGSFDGLYGRLPDGAAVVLSEVLAYLRGYLLEERGLRETRVRALMAAALPPQGRDPEAGNRRSQFRSVPRELEDEGIRVAIGLLNTLASTLRLKDGQIALDGRPLGAAESRAYLLSGRDGLRGMKVKAGGARRGPDSRREATERSQLMQRLVDGAARQDSGGTYRDWAASAAREMRRRGHRCSERTVRRHTRNPRSS